MFSKISNRHILLLIANQGFNVNYIVSLFIRLANACKDGNIDSLQKIDADIISEVCISLLCNQYLLEVLVSVAIAIQNFPLVSALAARGPPPGESETRRLWNWRGRAAGADGISNPAATTALLQHGWLIPKDSYAIQIMEKIQDVSLAIYRIDAL